MRAGRYSTSREGNMSATLGTSSLASWRMRSAVATQGISGDGIYAMIEREITARKLNGILLDYGAGVGNLTRRLLELGVFSDIAAVDILPEPNGLKTSRWLQQDLNEAIPGFDGQFDVVIASEVIEHLENPRFTARELYRLCRPGGHVIITTPNNESIRSLLALAIRGHFVHFDKGWYPGHITPLVRKDLIRILVEAGFDPIAFRFSENGSLPGAPTHTWQEMSFGMLRGVRFSNNLLISAHKPNM
jgi:2-polyprenyl-3-methyl-5-hydroxy-6-metoxy-1,4-benzoquinol methylase